MNPEFLNCLVMQKVFACGMILQINQLILLLIKYDMLWLLRWRSIACAIRHEWDVR